MVPILIAAAVALFTLGVSRVVRGFLHGEKRKLAERLSIDARFDPEAASARAIKIQLEQSELSPLLSRLRFLAVLHRHVIQAYPQTTLVRFLSLSAGVAVFAGFVMLMASASMIPALLAAAGAGYLPFFLVVASSSFIYVALADLIPQLQKRLGARETLAQIAWLLVGIGLVSFVSALAHTQEKFIVLVHQRTHQRAVLLRD